MEQNVNNVLVNESKCGESMPTIKAATGTVADARGDFQQRSLSDDDHPHRPV